MNPENEEEKQKVQEGVESHQSQESAGNDLSDEVMENAVRLQDLLASRKVDQNPENGQKEKKASKTSKKEIKKLRKSIKLVKSDLSSWSPKLNKAKKKGDKQKAAIYAIRVEAMKKYAQHLKQELQDIKP